MATVPPSTPARTVRVRRLPDIPAEARRLIIIVGLVIGSGRLLHDALGAGRAIDMMVYREGARVFLAGGSLYAEPLPTGIIDLPFIYPPFGALALTPFVFPGLGDIAASVLIVLINAALLGLCTVLVARAAFRAFGLPRWTAPAAALAWGVAMNLEALAATNDFGQINQIIMALAVVDLVPRRRVLPRGFFLGLAVAIKLTPLVLLLYFLLRREFRVILTVLATTLGAWAVAAAIRWDVTVEYFGVTLLHMGTRNEIGVNTAGLTNGSLKGMIMRWFPDQAALDAHARLVTALWLGAVLLTVALGAWLMHRLLRLGMPLEAWAVNAVVMLLISPISWAHHWVWLGVLIPLAAWRLVLLHRGGPLAWTLAAWTVLLLAAPAPSWIEDWPGFDQLGLAARFAVSYNVWFSLLMMLLLTVELRRARRATATGDGPDAEAPENGDAPRTGADPAGLSAAG